jgi:MOSC domain-containing protein YiiM
VSIGRLVAIARRHQRRMPMQEIAEGFVSVEAGLAGDCKGAKFPLRQVTVLAREAWEAAAAEAGDAGLPWTVPRQSAGRGRRVAQEQGGVLRIGPVRLEVTGQTYPCLRMEEARAGLLRALAKDWRGGVTCRVLAGGSIGLDEAVEVLVPAREVLPRLPG